MRAVATFLAAAALAACSASGPAGSGPGITVFAAASLVTALDPIVADYEAAHDADITVSYAASATLAQQIVAGADADIFISASLEWAGEVAKSRDVQRREDALGNGLVLVTPLENPARLDDTDDLTGTRVSHIAIGEPESVPAGSYAREALTTLGLWDRVQPKLVYTMDVRQALLYAEHGEVDAAIVYATDAAGSTQVKVIAALDGVLANPVRYSLVLFAANRDGAAGFFDYLLSAEALRRFESAGFTRLPALAGVS